MFLCLVSLPHGAMGWIVAIKLPGCRLLIRFLKSNTDMPEYSVLENMSETVLLI